VQILPSCLKLRSDEYGKCSPKFLNHDTRRRVTYCRKMTAVRNAVTTSVAAQCYVLHPP